MAGGNQRRDASRRRLQEQLALRGQRDDDAARRRTRVVMVAGAVVVVALIVVITVVVASSGGTKHPPRSTSSNGPYVARKTTGPCGYATANPTANPALRDVGMPPDPNPYTQATEVVDFSTNRGLIEATLDGKATPCNVQAVSYLIQKGFYDNSPCPRVVNSGIYVVQCGSGTKTTAGGPTFTVPDENLDKADYSAGAIAMANIGQPNTASSQFFFVTKDSNSGLQKSYTAIGHVTKGLDILQQVAAGGNDTSAGSAGGGAPKLALTFTTVRIVSVSGGTATPGAGSSATLRPVSTNS